MRKNYQSNKIRNLFLLTSFAVFITLDLVIAFYVISWQTIISIPLFIVLTIFIYSFSFQLTKKMLSLFVKPYKLYKLNGGLSTRPKVAILYSTMNDVLPECLSIIKQTYPCSVFVLDDSSLEEKREIVDRITEEKGFSVLRRKERKGFKAGAINNWINFYGKNYDYIVLLDSDSFIPADWVEKTLEYAENPLNSRVAIFQGLINIWNLDNKFIRTLSALHRIGQDVWEMKIANHLDAVFCYGHNVMLRMRPVLEVGGFSEGYTSEDFATAVKLASSGYKSRFVPLHTYEAMPENIRGFIKRQHKWTRGSMEFLEFIRSPSLTFTQKLLLFSIPLGHFSYIAILSAMFLTIFGYATTLSHFYGFLQNLFYYNIFFILSIPIFRFALALQAVTMTINLVKFKQLGISFYDSLKHETLSKAIGAIMLPYELISIASCAISCKVQWPVTPKHEPRMSFKEVLSISKITLLLSLIFIAGLILINPLGFIFNINWLIPFMLAPITLYFFSNDKARSNVLYSDGGNYGNKINAGESQGKEVFSFIRKIKFTDSKGLSLGNKKIIFAIMLIVLASLAGLFLYNVLTAYFIYPTSSLPTPSVCGNGICEADENVTSCPQDCIVNVTTLQNVTGGLKFVAPTYSGSRTDPKSIFINDFVKLSVYVEKLGDANVTKVWVTVKSPSGIINSVDLESNGIWSATVQAKEAGAYLATFNAVDESNSHAEPISITFTSTILGPSLIGGFGGGGIPPSAY